MLSLSHLALFAEVTGLLDGVVYLRRMHVGGLNEYSQYSLVELAVLVMSVDHNLLLDGDLLVLVHLVEVLNGLLGHHHVLVYDNVIRALMLVMVLVHVIGLLYLVMGVRVDVVLAVMLGCHVIDGDDGHGRLLHYAVWYWLPNVVELVEDLVSLNLHSVLWGFGSQLFLTVSERAPVEIRALAALLIELANVCLKVRVGSWVVGLLLVHIRRPLSLVVLHVLRCLPESFLLQWNLTSLTKLGLNLLGLVRVLALHLILLLWLLLVNCWNVHLMERLIRAAIFLISILMLLLVHTVVVPWNSWIATSATIHIATVRS